MSTRTDPLRIAITLVVAMCFGTSVAHAGSYPYAGAFTVGAPAGEPPTDAAPSEATPSEATPSEATPSEPPVEEEVDEPEAQTVEGALESGDSTTALEQARAAREAEPSAANWRREAQVLEQMGHYDAAATAYEAELAALPEGREAAPRRDVARDDLERVRAASRGTVAAEPASKHRERLDERWAPRSGPGKVRAPRPEPLPAKPKDERIVRKWYFWVTIIAITASAAAVTGIAVKAARDRKRDALDLTRAPQTMPPPVFRF